MIDKKLSQFDEKELNTNKNIRSIEKNNYITNHVDEKIENEDDPVNDKEENHNEHKKEDVSNKEKKEMLYKYSSKKKSKERRKIKINTKDSNEGGYLSLGICVRYAEEPFNKSKIVTFVNSYIFINRLPFDIKIVTDSVRKKSETFFISQNVNKLEINDTYKNLFQLERKKLNEHKCNNISSIQPLIEENETFFEKQFNNSNSLGKENSSNYEKSINQNRDEESCKMNTSNIENNIINNNKNTDIYNLGNDNYKNNNEHDIYHINNDHNISKSNSLNKHNSSINGNITYVEKNVSDNNVKKDSSKYELNEENKDNIKNEGDEKGGKNKSNETYIRKGEIVSFHYHRNHIRIKDSENKYSSLPFSLIPKNVPSNFQIELFNVNKSQINNTNNLLVEINICSGIFGDKQQLPYTYNGYFYILSLPVRPQFEIINATKFIIAYATDINKYTKRYMNSSNYNTYLNRYNKDSDYSVKMIYPYSSIYYTLRHNNEIESSKIALKIVGVQKSSWCINTINSFIDNVVILPYRIYGDNLLSRKTKRNTKNEIFKDDMSQMSYQINDSSSDKLSSKSDSINSNNMERYINDDEENDNLFLGHNLINKKLYSFLIIRDNGSRAIVITEKYNLARKIVRTKNFSKIHKLIALNSRKKILLSQKNNNKKYILNRNMKNFIYFNFPNVPIIYKFNIPRITFTWIHRQDVIIAIHLTQLKYNGHIYPKEIVNNDITEMFTPINILKKKELNEYVQFVFLNSYINSIFLIEQIHIDHFVKGDIPVILKSTNIEEDEKENIFLYIHIKQYCVDSLKQAPIYQSITIKISPLNANIELLVIEQLIEIIEKEKQLLLLYEKNDKSLPPLVSTSKTAKSAINTTLKIYSDRNFLQMLYMDEYIKHKMGHNVSEQNIEIENNRLINSVNRIDNTSYKMIGHKKRVDNIYNDINNMNIKPNAYSYYFSSTKARMIKHNKIININNISPNIFSDDSTKSSNSSKSSHKNKQYILEKKICKLLLGYYKYKKIHNLINNTFYNINNINDELLLPIKIQYFKNRKIFMNAFSSHLFLHPNPRWIDNKSKPVYIREFKIHPIEIIASIRTSEHRISRRVLHIVDALPLDTPSMRIRLISQKRNYIVCTWDGLFQSLRISYFRQLLRQSLPSAWLSNPFAIIKGFIKGLCALYKESVRGVKTSSNFFDGFMSGFKCGIIILVVNTVGGLFQSLSHMLNVCHKLMGGSRPRPPSILDSIILGLDGLILDTFYRPWVSLVTQPIISINKGNSTFKTTCIIIGCILRCIFSPVFGLLNFSASITEGFANTLIGDFERFSRVQERAEFETEKIHKSNTTFKKGKTLKKVGKKKV